MTLWLSVSLVSSSVNTFQVPSPSEKGAKISEHWTVAVKLSADPSILVTAAVLSFFLQGLRSFPKMICLWTWGICSARIKGNPNSFSKYCICQLKSIWWSFSNHLSLFVSLLAPHTWVSVLLQVSNEHLLPLVSPNELLSPQDLKPPHDSAYAGRHERDLHFLVLVLENEENNVCN